MVVAGGLNSTVPTGGRGALPRMGIVHRHPRGAPMSIAASNSLEKHWAPFTSNREFKSEPRSWSRRRACITGTISGGRLIDGSAGLFCAAAGHCRKEIAEACRTDRPWISPRRSSPAIPRPSSSRGAAQMPGDLNYVFFTNSGSESVDTAMKIALAYQRARGEGSAPASCRRARLSWCQSRRRGAVGPGAQPRGLRHRRRQVVHMRHTWLPENKF